MRATGWAHAGFQFGAGGEGLWLLIAQAATLEARVPFVHFFDGFRTSHEINKIEQLTEDDLRAMIDDDLVRRAPRSARFRLIIPLIRGTAQNPDVYFQARETVNPFYLACPVIVAERDGQVRRADRAAVSPVRLRRRARRRARDRDHGLRRRNGAGNRAAI